MTNLPAAMAAVVEEVIPVFEGFFLPEDEEVVPGGGGAVALPLADELEDDPVDGGG